MLEDLAQDILDVGMNSAAAQARRLVVRLIEDLEADRFTVFIGDDGKGMSAYMRECVLDGYATTKGGKPLGLGIAMLREAADLCEGKFRLFSRPNKGTILLVTMKHSHIDRPPLGDIAASIAALCCAEGNMAVRFEHRRGLSEFLFDSMEFLGHKKHSEGLTAGDFIEIERVVQDGLETMEDRLAEKELASLETHC